MNPQHKDLTIGDKQYRVGRLSAIDGSWIYTSFVKRYREYVLAHPPTLEPSHSQQVQAGVISEKTEPEVEVPQLTQEQGFLMTATFLVESLNRAELAEMQIVSLRCCAAISTATGSPLAMPVLMEDGRFTDKDLAFDGPAVLELVVNAIAFNVAPFFPGAGANEPKAPAVKDSSLPSTQT